MISTSGAISVYRPISPPTADDRQGAKPPAVRRATRRTDMRKAFQVRSFPLILGVGPRAQDAAGPVHGHGTRWATLYSASAPSETARARLLRSSSRLYCAASRSAYSWP